MNAEPLLTEIAAAIRDVKLEVVMIGNAAAAALQGAPVTTVDFDFLFRPTPRNLTKLKAIARTLKATILRPYYPASNLYRLVRDDDGFQVDFRGVRSLAKVRHRIDVIAMEGLSCVRPRPPRSKRSARRRRDHALLDIAEEAVKKRPTRQVRLTAVARESDRNLSELIRRWQALPPERRTNFLRRRIGFRGSAL